MMLSSTIIGRGPTVLILHGLFGEGKNWLGIAKAISHSFEVHLIDQRNHGTSFHSPNHDYQALCIDLDTYIKSKNITNFFLIGHSMGGKTAMQFALLHPDNINKLIIVDIAPKLYTEKYQNIFKGLKHVLSISKSRKEAETILMSYVNDIILTNFLLKSLFFLDNQPQFKFNINGIQKNIQNILMAPEKHTNFSGPTYFLCGEKSDYIQKKDIETINTFFPDNIIITIDNAGHWVHFDQKQRFLNCIQKILST